jgi:hypothetical protein
MALLAGLTGLIAIGAGFGAVGAARRGNKSHLPESWTTMGAAVGSGDEGLLLINSSGAILFLRIGLLPQLDVNAFTLWWRSGVGGVALNMTARRLMAPGRQSDYQAASDSSVAAFSFAVGEVGSVTIVKQSGCITQSSP